ncbi:MAG: hypothetical protein CFE25_17190 [Chitinophagaceae bacterium BSSC1]|nr:MAG: hypothetical protein CFE25_17190 [Chitinophagaceae bacterium BSSC1]
MSYKFRKEKRLLAHKILKYLSDRSYFKSTDLEIIRVSGFYKKKIYTPQTILQVRDNVLGKNRFETLMQALRLLEQNNHVIIHEENLKDGEIYQCTSLGEGAYLEEYYKIENRRDFLEEFELYTKWLFPSIAILLSLAAFILSILNGLSIKK